MRKPEYATKRKWSKRRKFRFARTVCLAAVMGSSFGWIWEALIK